MIIPTKRLIVTASCRKKELTKIEITGIKKVYVDTLLASPELTNVKKASQPNAITNIEINNKDRVNCMFHDIEDQLSVPVPNASRNSPQL